MLVLTVICRFGSAVMAAFRIKPASLAAKASRYLLQKFPDVSRYLKPNVNAHEARSDQPVAESR